MSVFLSVLMLMRVRVPVPMLMRMPMPVGMRLLRIRPLHRAAVHQDAEPRPRDAAARRLAAFNRDAREAEPRHGLREHFEGNAEITEIQAGPEEHIAGDPAGAVEVVNGPIVRHSREGYHAI
jgi:hypothetical protein